MAEIETNTSELRGAQPADEVTEKRWQLIHQNRAFIAALHAAIRAGSETAAGVTATVRTGRRKTLTSADRHDARSSRPPKPPPPRPPKPPPPPPRDLIARLPSNESNAFAAEAEVS
jgi:hypothetical protein